MKICSKCNKKKQDNEFYSYQQKSFVCKQCKHEYKKQWRKLNPDKLKLQRQRAYKNNVDKFERRFSKWQSQANSRQIKWALNIEHLQALPKICAYSGIELTLEANKPNTISLDRIDSLKGYTKDNIVFCCADINRMKQEFSKEYFLNMCKKIAAHNIS